jgi:hypothetical protein
MGQAEILKSEDSSRLLLDANLAEFQALRDEIIFWTTQIRRIPTSATYIVGVSIPIIATLMTINSGKEASEVPGNWSFLQSYSRGGEIAIIISMCLAYICVSLLFIYNGCLKQIHNIGRYIRQVIAPNINECAHGNGGLFQW